VNKPALIVVFAAFVIGVGILWAVTAWMNSGEDYVEFDEPVAREPVVPGEWDREDRLRLSVATMWSPAETFTRYRRLGETLGRMLGTRHNFVIRSSYREVREALEEGTVDVAVVCSGTLLHLMPKNAAEVLVIPQFMSGWEYRGIIIASADGPIVSVRDLEGGTLALTDPESLTGCLMPSALFLSLTEEPEKFFGQVLFTGSHDRAVSAVAAGMVDSAAVNGLVYHALCEESERIKEKTRIIWQSDVYGPPPILVPREMPREGKERIRAALLALHEDDEGFAILRSLGIRRFIAPSDGVYETARELYDRVKAAGGCPWL